MAQAMLTTTPSECIAQDELLVILTCHFCLYAGWLAESLQRAFLPSVPSEQPQRLDTSTVYSSMRVPVMWQMCLQRSEHLTALLTHLEQLKADICSKSQQVVCGNLLGRA